MTAPAAVADPAPQRFVLAPPRILVIGYGNPGRQDDGLGPAVVRAIDGLGWSNVSTLDNYQLTIEDAVDVAAHDMVWFVDAACRGDEPYAIHCLSPSLDITFTSHLVKPQTVLAIADQQFCRCPEAWLVSVRGYEFGFHEGLSDRAHDNLTATVALLRRWIGHVSGRAE